MQFDWDDWPKTNTSRCDRFAAGDLVTLDVDGMDNVSDQTDDVEAIAAICGHSGREK
jgi:hypothetical protein